MTGLLLSVMLSADPSPKDSDFVNVVIASVDIPAGTVTKAEMLSQRGIPKTLMTRSVVKAESAGVIIDQVVNYPLHQGDLILWGLYGQLSKQEDVSACITATKAGSTVPEQVTHAKTVIKTKAKATAKQK